MKNLFDEVIEEMKNEPLMLTEEQFDEAVEEIIKQKMSRNDNSYIDYIQMMIDKDNMKKIFDLRYFQGRDSYGKNYYWKTYINGVISK